jgi:hypothetical protein
MNNDRFVDRYFESESALLNIEHSEKKNINTLLTYLENLHSVGDKLKDKYQCNIKDIPEFVILRIIRNYFHHVDDIEEYSMFVELEEWGIFEYNRHLIISLKDFAKSLKNFIDNSNKKYQEKQIELINEFIELDIINNAEQLCDLKEIVIDENKYELGIDIFKYVYNISNIIADKCRDIDELKNKEIILNLESTHTEAFNIPKRDYLTLPGKIPILTTKGFVFPKDRSAIRRAD